MPSDDRGEHVRRCRAVHSGVSPRWRWVPARWPSRFHPSRYCPTPPRRPSTCRSPVLGSPCTSGRTCKPATICSSTPRPVASARRRCSSPSAAGARVIATAGSAEKVALCSSLGADLAINYTDDDFVESVLEATGVTAWTLPSTRSVARSRPARFRCMAFNGRHLLVGFASGIEAEDQGRATSGLVRELLLVRIMPRLRGRTPGRQGGQWLRLASVPDGERSMPACWTSWRPAACDQSWVVRSRSRICRPHSNQWQTATRSAARSSFSIHHTILAVRRQMCAQPDVRVRAVRIVSCALPSPARRRMHRALIYSALAVCGKDPTQAIRTRTDGTGNLVTYRVRSPSAGTTSSNPAF